jgi:hypothetical protein
MSCININIPEFKALVEASGLNPYILAAKVGVWQEDTNSDAIPSLLELGIEPKVKSDNIDTPVIKEGVSELFESNPELANIGTQEQYSQYLDTIFPDSKVKDIVVHLSRVPNIEKFKINDNTQGNFINSQVLGSGVYFASPDSIDYWSMELGFIDDITGAYTKNRNIYFAILNSKFPEEFQKNYIDDIDVKEGTDVVINQSRITGKREEYVVKNPDIIHILGSKQDIEGFKEFVGSQVATDNQNFRNIVDDNFADWASEDNDSDDPFTC